MAGEENRRMDLNLYLGLPRRRTESSDLGSDLALGSLPLSEEMSSSNTQSYPPVPQPAVLQGDSTVNGSNQDVEYNPYSPSFVPSSPTSQARRETQALSFQELGLQVPEVGSGTANYRPLYGGVLPPSNGRDNGEGLVMEGSSSNHGEYVYSGSYAPPSASRALPAELQEVQEENNHVPYARVPPAATQGGSDNVSSGPVIARAGSAFHEVEDGRHLVPEFRFRRYIDANPRLRVRRYRSRVPSSVNSDWSAFSSEAVAALAVAPDTRVPEVSAEANAIPQKASEKGVPVEDLEQNGENNTCPGAANFDCNVCFDMAKEPVVTSCGHLFCWPCLFQWLHIHCDHRECPVCKGEVTDADITPIYGRGNSEKETENDGKEIESGLKIPPRPRGRRLESMRQRIRRPFSRRPRDEIGSWSFIFDEEMNNRGEELEEPPTLRSFEGTNRRMISRLMAAQRFQWEDGFDNMLNFGGNGSSSNANEVVHVESHFEPLGTLEPPTNAPMLVRRGLDFWRRFNSVLGTDRLIPVAAEASNGTGGTEAGANNSGASASTSANPRASRAQRRVEAAAAADQASASSTIAVIQGESSVPLENLGEPSSVGSARTLRRSRRYTPSGSLDIDAVDQAFSRRRMN